MNYKIKIHNNDYEIIFVSDKNDNLLLDDYYHSGITDNRNKKIYINKDLNQNAMQYTLYHELTHAIIDSYGLLQIDWTEEVVCDFMGNYLITICDILNTLLTDKDKQNASKERFEKLIKKEN